MTVLALVILIGGVFVIAVLASDTRFGRSRRKSREDKDPNGRA